MVLNLHHKQRFDIKTRVLDRTETFIQTGYGQIGSIALLCAFSLFASCKEHCLHPNKCVLFTWDEPSCSKEFVWFVKGSQEMIETDLSKVIM